MLTKEYAFEFNEGLYVISKTVNAAWKDKNFINLSSSNLSTPLRNICILQL
jgi:hypothetical protein